jgi:glycosyltransferase involved in cell wall biosynthesis
VKDLPLVSIVTPSYNMAAYLPQTVESVLSQDYPNIEYIVMDAGSTDGTLNILEKYKDRLTYTSGPDSGSADAVNKGFRACKGSIFAWLNADDTYLPGAVSSVVQHFLGHPDAGAVYGQGYWVNDDGGILKPYPTSSRSVEELSYDCYFCQPACFVRSTAFQEAGGVNEQMHYAFDYDLWVRLSRRYPISYLESFLATSRMHLGNKSLRDRRAMFREGMSVLKRHFGYIPFHWIYSYVCYKLDKRDQFYNSLDPSVLSYCLSLPIGLRYNYRHMTAYSTEWLRVMSYQGLRRMMQRARERFSPRGQALLSNTTKRD